MTVEFIGILHYRPGSESIAGSGPAVQPEFARELAKAHETAGFDRVLIGYSSASGDGFIAAQHAAAHTERLGFLVAHRPGVVAPTVAARKFATLDQFTGGRASVNIISGGDDHEQRRDGDYLTHDERYERTGEYIEILKRIWTSDASIDHAGRHYRFEDNVSSVKPVQKPHVPVYFSGSSDAAIEIGARFANVYMLWAESLAGTRDQITRIRAAAARHGRADAIRFSLSVRPILAPTEEKAWERARSILEAAKALREATTSTVAAFLRRRNAAPANTGSLRLLKVAAEGAVVDKRLWTEIASLTGASGNSTALVGTAEQVAESLLDYRAIGVDAFLIRGFDPLADAIQYGEELIPLVRREAALRDAARSGAAAE
ncbi:LLM class flavin-dependent oxidoreductase [Methylosinus sp. RM1]|uniref:LLM class flavin-dependent oxidoreductase n=1 Tax=Methylosinus sp. RM1 TaxID=2583817 RepID=UPI00140C18B0|nr:LLM class flavin-dependent oxidoreductase [Methylosinus sp. RM1]